MTIKVCKVNGSHDFSKSCAMSQTCAMSAKPRSSFQTTQRRAKLSRCWKSQRSCGRAESTEHVLEVTENLWKSRKYRNKAREAIKKIPNAVRALFGPIEVLHGASSNIYKNIANSMLWRNINIGR